jgi:DNA-binding MarR family transcriptional regulator
VLIGRQVSAPRPLLDTDEVSRLRVVLLRLARELRRLAADEGLTPAGAGVLGLLVARGPLRAGDVAAAEAINPTMVSRVLGELETAGLVSRNRDAADGRATIVRPTAAGTRRARALKKRRNAVLAERFGALEPAQLDALLAALPALEALAGLTPPP